MLTLKELPIPNHPRERLTRLGRLGANTLRDYELLAIILGSGTKELQHLADYPTTTKLSPQLKPKWPEFEEVMNEHLEQEQKHG